jgi:MoaA/NifB/PqqE/SkfB family radical SAM enzyme
MAVDRDWEKLDSANSWHISPAGELLPGMELGQSFVCRGAGLHRVELLLANYQRPIDSTILVRLHEDSPGGRVLFQQSFNTLRVADNAWQSFDFPPIPGSGGNRYYLSLTSLGSQCGAHITVWHHPKVKLAGGALYRNGQMQKRGALSFRAWTLQDEAVNRRYREFRRAWAEGVSDYREQPLQLYVEVTSRCNISCIMCRDRDGSVMAPQKAGSAAGFMVFDLFRDLRPLLERVFTVNLFGWGEPMLHKEFIRFIEFTRECNPDCRINFNTNGTLLNAEKAGRLVELDVTRVCFSIDSPDPETFEKIRRGARYHQVISNIERLRMLRDSRLASGQESRLTLAMEQVVMQPNVGQLKETVQLASRLGIGELYLEQLFGPFPDLIIEHLEPHLHSYRAAREAALELEVALIGPMVRKFETLLEKEDGIGTPESDPASTADPAPDRLSCLPAARCPEPWQTIFVDRTGNVIPCCFQQSCTKLGRIPDLSPDEVWHGEEYQTLRRGVVDEPYYPGCENCIAAELPPPPILPPEWMNSLELAPPGAETVGIPPAPPLPPRGPARIARAIWRRLPGRGGR